MTAPSILGANRELPVMDLVYLLLLIVLYGITHALIVALNRLKGSP